MSKIIMAVKVLALDATPEEQKQIKSELEILHRVTFSLPLSLSLSLFDNYNYLHSVTRGTLLVSMVPSSMRIGYQYVPNTWTVGHVTYIHADICTITKKKISQVDLLIAMALCQRKY